MASLQKFISNQKTSKLLYKLFIMASGMNQISKLKEIAKINSSVNSIQQVYFYLVTVHLENYDLLHKIEKCIDWINKNKSSHSQLINRDIVEWRIDYIENRKAMKLESNSKLPNAFLSTINSSNENNKYDHRALKQDLWVKIIYWIKQLKGMVA